MKTYCIDIDNTICKTEGTDYPNSKPKFDVICKVNQLYQEGHIIKIFTGRGSRSGKHWREFTDKQLQSWGLKYHELIMGKPHCDCFIDDKAVNVKEWMIQ